MRNYTIEIGKYLNFINNVLISYSDKEGNILDVSEAPCRLSGYAKEELIGKPYSIFRHKDMKVETFENL